MSDKSEKQSAKSEGGRNIGKWIGLGAAGVGSAAVAAAVLYAGRAKPKSAVQPGLSARADDAVD